MLASPDLTAPRPFKWAAARTAGASHEASGEPCQDALTLRAGRCHGMPYVVAAVADGAGSARFAGEASRIATRLFTRFITSEIADWGLDGLDDLVLDASYGVHCQLRRLAAERSVHADHVATTLLGLVATPDMTAFVQIGDGGIVAGPPWRLIFPPQHGEYHNESRFIGDADAFDWLQISVVPGPPGTLMLFTDGLEDLLIEPTTLDIHPPLFDHVGGSLARRRKPGLDKALSADLADLLVSGAVRSRTNDDTTLLAIRLEETAS